MKRTILIAAVMLGAVCFFILPAHAEGWGHGRAGFGRQTIIIQPYSGWGYGWGWYPYWGAYYPLDGYSMDSRGTVKISDSNKSDQVYINGALAGSISKTHNFKLSPGRYDIQIRQGAKQILNEPVYVISGKTIELKVD